MPRYLVPFVLLVLPLLVACDDGSGIPSTNVRDYHVTFTDAFASSSCPEPLHSDADAHEEYSQTYRIHFVDGPDEARVDLYWKSRGDADSAFVYFAGGVMTGTLDEGNFDYAGGSYEETRGSDQLVYRVEGTSRVRFADELVGGIEEFIVEDSSNTADYPIGCVYTLEYTGDLASATDQGAES